MNTSAQAELLAMAVRAENNSLPASHIRRPSTFLSLAPTTSASYPVQRAASLSLSSPRLPAAATLTATTSSSTTAAATEAMLPTAEELEAAAAASLKHRRSSSLASDESASKLRFLKLGPVHWGEGDGTGDWSEVSVAE